MTISLAFDIGLAGLILATGAWTVVARDAHAAVIGFVVYGLLLAIAWVRLAAPDVALTEVAIGSGMTGMLLLGAAARVGTGLQAARIGFRGRLAIGVLCGMVSAGLAIVILFPPETVRTLAPMVMDNLAQSGLGNPVAGVLFVLYNAYVTPGTLHWSLSGEGIVMAVIGGAHAVWGPALGSVIFFLLKDAAGDLTEHWPAIIGITLIVVTVMVPRGISGLIMTLLGKMKDARR